MPTTYRGPDMQYRFVLLGGEVVTALGQYVTVHVRNDTIVQYDLKRTSQSQYPRTIYNTDIERLDVTSDRT